MRQPVRISHCRMNDLPKDDVDPLGKRRILQSCFPPSQIRDVQGICQCRVRKGVRRGMWNGTWHVGDAIVDNPLFYVSRFAVGRWAATLRAATLIDRNVNKGGTGLHSPEALSTDQPRRLRPGMRTAHTTRSALLTEPSILAAFDIKVVTWPWTTSRT